MKFHIRVTMYVQYKYVCVQNAERKTLKKLLFYTSEVYLIVLNTF